LERVLKKVGSNCLNLSCVLIDQMVQFDRDGLRM
jgi:hypothetical protein